MVVDYSTELIVLLVFISFTYACPDSCTCKWKSGKQTVECADKGFLAIPKGIDPGTQVLEFSRNNLGTLQKELFLKLDLINLQRIYLSDCGIISIHDRAFVGLTNLVELDLTNNLISAVPTESFIACPSLMRLTLNGNPITNIQRAAFSHLSYLNTLELHSCEISTIEEGAFQGLYSLEWLHLNGNRLTTLVGPRVLPESLKGIELQDNKWECDCHILDFRAWLLAFRVPQRIEPICNGPIHHKGQNIKTVPISELACLPTVSPTSFYLELSEGKNVSLMCHIHAIPEAKVTWWIHGQMLQNDSLVAPGMRLIYYIEEGSQDKLSELYILNARSEDNGTYVCKAENFAGKAEANFTIRIVLKEEPIVIIVSFPFEYLMAVTAGAVALAFILVIIAIASILRCRRNRRRLQKREQTKEITLQYQQNISKCSLLRENADRIPDPLKSSESNADQQNQIFLYTATSEERLRTMSPPLMTTNQVSSPPSLKRYQLEQNPDLINDTESVGRRREGDGEDNTEIPEFELINSITPQNLIQFSTTCLRESNEFYNSGGLVDREGYPVDYGLPKLRRPLSDNFYRTLPYNRGNKRQSAANPMARCSREAEFLSHSSQPASYEHYCPDVRYTADGYPVRAVVNAEVPLIPSPPEGYKTDAIAPTSLPCCSNQQVLWPTCVPANLHMVNANPEYNQSKYANISKRCVGAQTESEATAEAQEPAGRCTTGDNGIDVPTESPDEGYEGESAVV